MLTPLYALFFFAHIVSGVELLFGNPSHFRMILVTDKTNISLLHISSLHKFFSSSSNFPPMWAYTPSLRTFSESGFDVKTDYMSVQYTYVASGKVRWLLPVYNFVDTALFYPSFLKHFRPFLLTWGLKQTPEKHQAAG